MRPDSTPEEINYMEQSDKDFEISTFWSSEDKWKYVSSNKWQIWSKSSRIFLEALVFKIRNIRNDKC